MAEPSHDGLAITWGRHFELKASEGSIERFLDFCQWLLVWAAENQALALTIIGGALYVCYLLGVTKLRIERMRGQYNQRRIEKR